MANYLEAIARELRRPEEQLRLPADLLRQGYDPSYLARMRPDELYQLDASTLARIKRAMRYQDQLADFKQEVREEGRQNGWWSDAYEHAVSSARTRAEVTAVVRNVRSRRSSTSLAASNPLVQQIAAEILVFDGPPPADPQAWIAERAGLEGEKLEKFLQELRAFIQALLLEDAALVSRIFLFIKNNAVVQSSAIGEPAGESAGAGDTAAKSKKKKRSRRERRPGGAAESGSTPPQRPTTGDEDAGQPSAAAGVGSDADAGTPSPSPGEAGSGDGVEAASANAPAEQPPEDSQQEQQSNGPGDEGEGGGEAMSEPQPSDNAAAADASEGGEPPIDGVAAEDRPPQETAAAVEQRGEAEPAGAASPIESFKKERPAKPTRSVSTKELSPRQRRRRWLKIQLKPYNKLRRSLSKLSPYQVVMLDRGNRSQILKVELDYDRKAVANMARESLRVADHPFSAFLREAVDYSVDNLLTGKVEQDVFAAVEEQSQQQLIEYAVEHLHALLLQRPVRGQRIFLIDAIGKTTAAGVIIDPEGRVDHVCDIPCTSVRAEAVNQTVSMIGELVHRFQVTLIALSTGPQRRFLLPCVREFLQQSDPSTIRWTMVDRDGAEMYCQTRLALQELPTLSRRHRAATWLAWRLQDPLVQLLKVEPTQLRLTAFQAELPPELVRESLQDAVAAAVAARGLDYWNAPIETLATIPGLDRDAAKTVVSVREEKGPASREALAAELQEKLPPNTLRQAIGFMRVFDSPQPLDGTLIHPDDYRLAQRLIEATELSAPPATPPGWAKRPTSIAGQPEETGESVGDSPAIEASATTADDARPFGPGADDAASSSEADNRGQTAADALPAADEPQPEETSVAANGAEEAGAAEPVDEGAEGPQADAAAEAETPTPESSSEAGERAPSPPDSKPTAGRAAVQTLGGHELMKVTPNFEPEAAGSAAAAVDVEKFARMWQVGREKLKFVAHSLQHPFDDLRDRSISIPLMPRVPKIEDLQVGQSYWAVISGIVEFGAFADLGPDCSGLIHVSQLTQNFVIDPHQVANIGDLVQVWVLEIDPSKRRVSLSALSPEIREHARDGGRGFGDREPYRGRRDGDRGRDDQRPPREGYGRGKFAGANQGDPQARAGDPRSAGGEAGRGQRRSGGQGGGPRGGQGGGQGGGAPAGQGARGDRGGNRDNRSGGPRQDRGGRDDRRGRGGFRGGRAGGPNLGAATVVDLPSKDLPKKPQPSEQPAADGKEPLRSFSDLLKSFQSKHEQTKGRAAPPSEPPPTEGGEQQ